MLAGVFCWSILALITLTKRCHSQMLAAEIKAPVASIAPLRHPPPISTAKAATSPKINVLRMRPVEHCVQVFMGKIDDRMGFLGHGGSSEFSLPDPFWVASSFREFFSFATAC